MRSVLFSITNNGLLIGNNEIITESAVAQAVQTNDKIIVRFDVPVGIVKNNNVNCYDRFGNLLWTIQKSQHGGSDDNPYVSIKLDETESVIVENYNGVEYAVNVSDGTVSSIGTRRF